MTAAAKFDSLFSDESVSKSAPKWTAADEAKIKKNYHKVKRSELNAMFPSRTPSAVNNKVYKMMKAGELSRKAKRVRVKPKEAVSNPEVTDNSRRRIVSNGGFTKDEMVFLEDNAHLGVKVLSEKLGVRVSSVRRFLRG